MKKIDMPDWDDIINSTGRVNSPECFEAYSNWFETNLKDKYIVDESELVEVTGYTVDEGVSFDTFKGKTDTHKAYLIGIEPINDDTPAEKILRKIVKIVGDGSKTLNWTDFQHNVKKAREILEEK